MKIFRNLLLVLAILVVGYGLYGFIQKKNFEEKQQQEREQHTIEVFGEYSAKYEFEFPSYQSAKRYFKQQAGVENIGNLQMYTTLNEYNDVPVLGGTIRSDMKNNRCEYGYLNLVTGEWKTREDVCIIFN